MKHKLWHRAAFVLLGSVAIAACNDSTDPTPTASAMEAVTATTITGSAGQAASISPTVRVTGPGGAPVAGAIVEFRITSGLGSVQFADVQTDANGVASAGVWTLGPFVGVQTVTASVEGAAPIVFSSNTGVGPPGQVTITAGNNQSAVPGTAVATNPSVLVRDAFNAVIANQTVTFTVLTGGGTIAGGTSTTVTTNASGIATAGPWVLGPNPGPNTLRAQAGTAQVTFTATGLGPCESPVVMTVGGSANGTLATSDCTVSGVLRDNYTLAVTAGQAVLITLNPTGFSPVIYITTSATPGVPLAISAGSTLRFIPTVTGTVIIGASASAGGETGSYSLSVASTTTAVTACSPPNAAQVGITSLAQELTSSDCLTPGSTPWYNVPGYDGTGPYRSDVFLVYLTAGQQIRIRQIVDPALDGLIAVFSPTNARSFADNGFPGDNEELLYTAATTGVHRVIFTSFDQATGVSFGSDFGPYTMSITTP